MCGRFSELPRSLFPPICTGKVAMCISSVLNTGLLTPWQHHSAVWKGKVSADILELGPLDQFRHPHSLKENVMMYSRARGFTLIELLVVIAVIALLMGILLPALNKAKALGQNAKCKGNLKQYAIAVQMYADDHDGKLMDPRHSYFSQSTAYPIESGLSNARQVRWCNGDLNLKDHPEYGGPFLSYISDARAFICPTFKTLSLSNSEDSFYQADAASLRDYKPWYNYTQNAYLGPKDGSLSGIRVSGIYNVAQPALTFSFCEESSFVDKKYNLQGLNDTLMIPGNKQMVNSWLASSNYSIWDVRPGEDGQFWDALAGFHHAPSGDRLAGRGNSAFLDGHVDARPRSETFPLAWPRNNPTGPIK
ncbi:MAG: type II secretion system protein [Planctomycetota bacterium]